MAQEPLAGLRVLDFTQYISGPYCTRLLADYGAKVIKVERPEGDPCRQVAPFVGDKPHPEGSCTFHYLNAGKRGITLDLKTASGVEAVRRLAAQSDIVVESFRPGTMERLRLGYQELAQINPRLVFTSVTDFGPEGPYRDYKANHAIISALSGLAMNTGRADRPPLTPGFWYTHYMTGILAATATLIAILHAEKTGQGQRVDISCLEAVVGTMVGPLGEYTHRGVVRSRRPTDGLGIFPCLDGWIALNALQHQLPLVCNFLGLQHILEDPRFSTAHTWREHGNELRPYVAEKVKDRSTAELFHSGQRARVPMGLVPNPVEVLAMEQYRARGFLVEVEHPVTGKETHPGTPFIMSSNPWRAKGPAPTLGQHSEQVQKEGFGRSGASTPVRKNGVAARKGASPLPLEGVRVLDLSQGWAGPTTCYLLGDMGAEVLKVEAIQRLDWWRVSQQDPSVEKWWERRGCWNHVSRNKYDVTLNLNDPKGARLLKELVKVSDILVENYSVRVMDKFGLPYRVLRELNPSLIMLSMPAFGATGPWRDYVGFGTNVEQTSGLTYLNGYGDGQPLNSGASGDPIAGYTGALAAVLALRHRSLTGEGQYIDLSHIEACTRLMGELVVDASINGKARTRWGNGHASRAPHGVYRCQGEDAWVVISVGSDAEWEALRRVMGNPPWVQDPRFSEAVGRYCHQKKIDQHLQEWTSQQDKHQVMRLLQKAGVPAAAVQDAKEVAEDAHLNATGLMVAVERPVVGKRLIPGIVTHLSETPGSIRRPPPGLGEHNGLVLGELLGVSPAEMERLAATQVIGDRPVESTATAT